MRLFNLVSADFKRLKKDTPLRVILIICFALMFLTALILKIAAIVLINSEVGAELSEYSSSINASLGATAYLSNLALGNLGFYIAIAVAIFIGKDFSYNTIRNKIISGNSRVKIYFSTLTTSLFIGLVYYVFTVAIGLLLSVLFFGSFYAFGTMAQMTLLAILPYISIITIIVFISMALKSQALGITFNLLVIMLLPGLLSMLAIFDELSATGTGNLSAVLGYIPFTLLSELLSATNIFSTFIEASGLSTIPALGTSIILRSIFVPIVYTGIFATLGVLIFRKAEIK